MRCSVVVFGVTLRLLVINISSSSPTINTAAYYNTSGSRRRLISRSRSRLDTPETAYACLSQKRTPTIFWHNLIKSCSLFIIKPHPQLCLLQLFGLVFRWNQRLRPKLIWLNFGLSQELRLTNHRSAYRWRHRRGLTHCWFHHISLFIFELVKKWSDFCSSKLNL